jgi:hypothetical protein
MPLQWSINSGEQLIDITAKGNVTRADVDGLLDAVVGAKALGYRKIVDCTAGILAMNAEDIIAIAVRVRELHQSAVIGAAALVLPEEPMEPVNRLLGALAAANRPLRLFRSRQLAEDWIKLPRRKLRSTIRPSRRRKDRPMN